MVIRRMRASFGRLNNEELTLHEGLNLIGAPNESGKSTWCAFLRTMFYGINTSERAKAGLLPDKTRYLPWSGAAQSGSLELDCARGHLELSRQGRAGKPMDSCTVTEVESGRQRVELCGKAPGETLLGVPEAVFRRSAFIERKSIALDKNGELEKRISSLVSTGDEQTSYSEAAERLKKAQNRRKSSRGGRIPQLEREAAELEGRLRELDGSDLYRLEAETEQARAQVGQLEAASVEAKRAEAAEAARRLKQAEAELETQRRELAALRASLGSVDRAATERAREALGQFEAQKREAQAQGAALTPPEKPEASRPKRWPAYLFALLGLLAVLSHWLGVPLVAAALVGGALMLTAVVLLLRALLRERAAAAEQAQYLERLRAYETERERQQARTARVEQAEEALHLALAPLLPAPTPKERILATEQALADCLRAETREQSLVRLVQERDTPLAREGDPSFFGQAAPALAERLNAARQHLAEASAAEATARGRLCALGDPLVLSTELAGVREELAAQSAEYEALTLAAQALQEASDSLRGRFSPLVSERAAAYFSELTGGRYDRVAFDSEMRFRTRVQGEPTAQDAQYLSDGTLDQLYLAVRLAICELALPSDDPCPLVLDDALAAFDDERALRALRLLRRLAEHRQILLFTCSSRESELLQKA